MEDRHRQRGDRGQLAFFAVVLIQGPRSKGFGGELESFRVPFLFGLGDCREVGHNG